MASIQISDKMRSEFPHMNESNAKIFEEARTIAQEGFAKGKEELKATVTRLAESKQNPEQKTEPLAATEAKTTTSLPTA